MAARRLAALDAFDAGGAPIPAAARLGERVGSAVLRGKLGDPERLTLTGLESPAGTPLVAEYAALTRRAIVRATFETGGTQETTFWRVREGETAYGDRPAWSVALDPLWIDLDGTVVAETLAASGFVDLGVTLAGRLDDVLARLLSPAYGAPTSPATFALGLVDPALAAQPVFLALSNASTLDGIRQALQKAGGEAEFVAAPGSDGTLAHYLLHVQERVGSQTFTTRPALGTGPLVNRQSLTRRRADADYFSHLVATADAGEGTPLTLASATWGVAAATAEPGGRTRLTLAGDPVWEDGALVGLAVRAPLGGPLLPIVASEAPGTLLVQGDASALTSLVVREADGRELVALPAATRPHGARLRRVAMNVPPWSNALADAGASADFSAFTGGVPRGWAKVGSPAVAAVTSEGHVRYGTSSVQVTAASGEGLVSLPISRADARQVSAWVGAYVVDGLGGRIRLEILDEDGTVHPVGEKADSTSETLQGLSIGGAPVTGATFRVRVVADSPTATFILDAATATRSAAAQPYAEAMGPNALWREAAKVVRDEGGAALLDAYDARFWDLAAILPGYDEVRLGDTVEIAEDGPHGLSLATRVVETEETFVLGEASVQKRVRLSTKRADLRRLFEAPPPADPVPTVTPVRRPQPSAQYAVGFRHGEEGATVLLTWLGNADVKSVRHSVTVGTGAPVEAVVNAAAGQVELAGPLVAGTSVEVRVTAYSEANGAGEAEAAPYRLVTDVPSAARAEDFAPGTATVTVQGTPGEVEVVGEQTQAVKNDPVFTLGLPSDVRLAATVGVLGGPYVKRINDDQLGLHAHRADGSTPYAYWVAKGYLVERGGTFKPVAVRDGTLQLDLDAERWAGLRRGDYLDQPVRRADAPTFVATGSTAFASGFAGHGWRIGTADGGTAAEVDTLTVRRTLGVYELLARRVDAVGGSLYTAPMLRVGTVSGSGTAFTVTDERASALGGAAVSDAEVGAWMVAQQATGAGVQESVVKVTGKTGSTLTLTLVSGSPPWPGAVYATFDHDDPARRGYLYQTSRDAGAPYYAVVVGAGTGHRAQGEERVRLGQLSGLTALGVPLSGWGLWADTAFLSARGQGLRVTPGRGVEFVRLGGSVIGAINAAPDGLTISGERVRMGGTTAAALADDFATYRRALSTTLRELFSRAGEAFNRLDTIEAWRDLPNASVAGVETRVGTAEAELTALAGVTTDRSAALAALRLAATSSRADLDALASYAYEDEAGVTHTGIAGLTAWADEFGSRAVLRALADGRVAGVTAEVSSDPAVPSRILLDAKETLVTGTLKIGGWSQSDLPGDGGMLRYGPPDGDHTRLEASPSFAGLAVRRGGRDVMLVGDDEGRSDEPEAIPVAVAVPGGAAPTASSWTSVTTQGPDWDYDALGAGVEYDSVAAAATSLVSPDLSFPAESRGRVGEATLYTGGVDGALVRLFVENATTGAVLSEARYVGGGETDLTASFIVPENGYPVRVRLRVDFDGYHAATRQALASITGRALARDLRVSWFDPAVRLTPRGLVVAFGPSHRVEMGQGSVGMSIPEITVQSIRFANGGRLTSDGVNALWITPSGGTRRLGYATTSGGTPVTDPYTPI